MTKSYNNNSFTIINKKDLTFLYENAVEAFLFNEPTTSIWRLPLIFAARCPEKNHRNDNDFLVNRCLNVFL